jgi:hypothetical protein
MWWKQEDIFPRGREVFLKLIRVGRKFNPILTLSSGPYASICTDGVRVVIYKRYKLELPPKYLVRILVYLVSIDGIEPEESSDFDVNFSRTEASGISPFMAESFPHSPRAQLEHLSVSSKDRQLLISHAHVSRFPKSALVAFV